MIISHQHKFIFIKPTKVAGTSIEVALSSQCIGNDIVTNNIYSGNIDSDQFEQTSLNKSSFYSHELAESIKRKIGKQVWEEYTKITVVRNPWDFMVSLYFWQKMSNKKYFESLKLSIKNIKQHLNFLWRSLSLSSFSLYVVIFFIRFQLEKLIKKHLNYKCRLIDPKYLNSNFYFEESGKLSCDYYIFYENLDADFDRISQKLKLPKVPLLKLKTKVRKSKKDYTTYYNRITKYLVEYMFKKEIQIFKYSFKPSNI